VPLIDRSAAALDGLSRREHHSAQSDYVFADDDGGALDHGGLRKRFYADLERAGLGHKRTEHPPLRFHDLRHTLGTLAVREWDIRKVQGYMGHSRIETTTRYLHHVPKHRDAKVLNDMWNPSSALPRASWRRPRAHDRGCPGHTPGGPLCVLTASHSLQSADLVPKAGPDGIIPANEHLLLLVTV
jgi:Phage integrase family